MAKSSCQFLHGRELKAKARSALGQQHENIHSICLHLAQASHKTLPSPRSLTFVPVERSQFEGSILYTTYKLSFRKSLLIIGKYNSGRSLF